MSRFGSVVRAARGRSAFAQLVIIGFRTAGGVGVVSSLAMDSVGGETESREDVEACRRALMISDERESRAGCR
jgi:hypothetical protein